MSEPVREQGEEARPADGEAAAAEQAGPAALPRSWRELYPPRPKPEGVDYGFLSARGEPVASTRENLVHLARTRALPSLAWSPETPEMVPPWEVPMLLHALREEVAARARHKLRIAIGGSALLLLAFWVFTPPVLALVLTLFIGAILGLLIGSIRRRVRQAERLSAEELSRGFDAMVEQRADAALPIPATRSVALPIMAVGVVQLITFTASIDAGAVNRDAVAAGEWWRLLTAPMLHGGLWHFWLNYTALESLGRTMETRGPRAWVPLVFLLAALAGSAASLALPPHGNSVGASGGLMGMFGFLAVMAYRRKRHLPEGFLKGLLINIALIAAVGAVAYRFIDNAAHGGGLAAGVLIGLAAIPGDGRVPAWTGGPLLGRAGYLATGIVWLSAAVAILLSLAAAFG